MKRIIVGVALVMAALSAHGKNTMAQETLTGAEITEALTGKLLIDPDSEARGTAIAWEIRADGTRAIYEDGAYVVHQDRWQVIDDRFCILPDGDSEPICYTVTASWNDIAMIPVAGGETLNWVLEDRQQPADAGGAWLLLKADEIKSILVGGVLNSDGEVAIAWEILPDGRLTIFEDGTPVADEKWRLDGDNFCRVTQGAEFCYAVEQQPDGNGIRLDDGAASSDWIIVHAQ